jgi:hypothetical protein
MGISAKNYTDDELYATEMEKALVRLDAHIRVVPLTTEDVVTDHAEKDAARILKGITSYTAMAPFRNILQAGNKNPESSYYGCGKKFYDLYCRTVEKTVKTSNPERKLNFPIWKE